MNTPRRHPRRSIRRPPTNARELALTVLDEHKRTAQFAATLLDDQGRDAGMADIDRRLAREIVFTVIRRQSTLSALIEPHVARPRHQIEGPLWTLLQIGVCQLVFLDSIPAHAAVHETVETARRMGKPRWCGLLNGVLRSVSRSLTEEYKHVAGADAVPIAAGEYRTLTSPVFPDPAADRGGYFARAFSFPDWLAARWEQRFEFDELCRLGFWFNAPPQLCLRVNSLRANREQMLGALTQSGIAARAGELDEAIWLDGSTRVESLPGFDEGWFVVQDESAMRAARLLAPNPGDSVLDLCAAPGTKTTHLAALMNNDGGIIAADIAANRLERVSQNVRRLGVEIIQCELIRDDGSDAPAGPFDRVLVDVPCSNTGVLGKRPEARWRIQPDDLAELPEIQQKLLSLACDRVKPGGSVVYSTCSIEPDENREVVRVVLHGNSEMELIQEIEHIPGRPGDGGYLALLRRRSDRNIDRAE